MVKTGMAKELQNLAHVMDRVGTAAADRKRVSLGMVMNAVGSRSFGPLLVMVGLILFSPLSGIPGMPTTMGAVVLLIAVQLVLGRKKFWLPGWLLARDMDRKKLENALDRIRPAARFIDRWLQPRLVFFTRGPGIGMLAIACMAMATMMPLMEIVPFSATSAGVILTLLGLSLIAGDGLMALTAYILTTVILVVIGWQLV